MANTCACEFIRRRILSYARSYCVLGNASVSVAGKEGFSLNAETCQSFFAFKLLGFSDTEEMLVIVFVVLNSVTLRYLRICY